MQLLNKLPEFILIVFMYITDILLSLFPTIAFVYVMWIIGRKYLGNPENIKNEVVSQFKLRTILLVNIIFFSALGLFLGFFLPLKFSNSPQGPLLGIFCTGPLGAFVGYGIFYLLAQLLKNKK